MNSFLLTERTFVPILPFRSVRSCRVVLAFPVLLERPHTVKKSMLKIR